MPAAARPSKVLSDCSPGGRPAWLIRDPWDPRSLSEKKEAAPDSLLTLGKFSPQQSRQQTAGPRKSRQHRPPAFIHNCPPRAPRDRTQRLRGRRQLPGPRHSGPGRVAGCPACRRGGGGSARAGGAWATADEGAEGSPAPTPPVLPAPGSPLLPAAVGLRPSSRAQSPPAAEPGPAAARRRRTHVWPQLPMATGRW